MLAVLEHSGAAFRDRVVRRPDGRLLGSVRVGKLVAPSSSASDQLDRYRVGRVVHAVDVVTGTISRIVKTRAKPIGLSLDGSRLAWAENVGGRGTIRAIFLRGRG